MMKDLAIGMIFLVLLLGSAILVDASSSTAASAIVDLPGKIVSGVRRHLNFDGLLGSPTRPTNASPYEKIMGHPVFQVTTSWGSAYMNMEMLTMEDIETNSNSNMLASRAEDAASFGAQDSQYRTISLYYMDPDDAIGAHAEFKQMEGMTDSDVRVTTVSLAKALRSASNLGRGLLTGQPIDAFKGTVLPTKEGGSLRHKIMPPKKQLFYATRCHGRERIGLFGKGDKDNNDRDSRYDQAVAAVIGSAALAYRNSQRRQSIRDRKLAYKPKSKLEADYLHMDGYLGIPVFYAPGMERRRSRIKSLVSGSQRKEIPLFFNYEDLQMAWQKTRPLGGKGEKYLPNKPPQGVEVFNLWDVLTSMEKEQARRAQKFESLKPQDKLLQALKHPFVNRWRNVAPEGSIGNKENDNLLDAIVFIPSSDACTYKEKMTDQGDSKCRLKPMR